LLQLLTPYIFEKFKPDPLVRFFCTDLETFFTFMKLKMPFK